MARKINFNVWFARRIQNKVAHEFVRKLLLWGPMRP
ncbi:hypothetical protein LINPERPRIM_LOCUS4108 [Linum perenne]